MYIHWKSITILGFLFWIFLFTNDVFQKPVCSSYNFEPPPVYIRTKTSADAVVKEASETPVKEAVSEENKANSYFGLTMLLANIIIFLFSVVFCSVVKLAASTIFRGYPKEEKALTNLNPESYTISPSPSVEVDSESLVTNEKTDQTDKKSLADQTCQTIFQMPVLSKQEHNLKAECLNLKEELTTLRSDSIKEHALLSRKLDSMAKEKRELIKKLGVLQKENQTAKNQLAELLNEKNNLLKRLETATKEYRFNTKTKKVALAKLEELSTVADDLKRQLEQVTRDKEILQGKLEILRNEYEKLQETLSKVTLKNANPSRDEIEKAERDENIKEEVSDKSNDKFNEESSTCNSSLSNLNKNFSKESVFLPYVISQTELDMKNIQMRILQLEESLKEFDTGATKNVNFAEPDFQLRITGSDIMKNNKVFPSDFESFDKSKGEEVEMLRHTLREKIKLLESMKEKSGDESSSITIDLNNVDGVEISSEENLSSQRFVSNSEAFQKFLKNINNTNNLIAMGDFNIDTE